MADKEWVPTVSIYLSDVVEPLQFLPETREALIVFVDTLVAMMQGYMQDEEGRKVTLFKAEYAGTEYFINANKVLYFTT